MIPTNSQIVAAHAKLTLSLRVTGVRQDGLHLIDAEMVTLDLADELQITAVAESGVVRVVGRYANGVGTDPNNLVSRALILCGRQANVQITKNIPHGGGLGGGSADAAAILRWAKFDDRVAASKIGADIPFCMIGGRAIVQGIGEIITPLPFVAHDITLIIPPFGVSTPTVYKAWDSLARATKAASSPATNYVNDLEAAALIVEPRLVKWRDQIAQAAGVMPSLAGSGATWWIYGARPELAAVLAKSLPEATVLVTKTR